MSLAMQYLRNFQKTQTKTYEVNEVIVATNKEIIKNDPELQNFLQCIENQIAPQRLKETTTTGYQN